MLGIVQGCLGTSVHSGSPPLRGYHQEWTDSKPKVFPGNSIVALVLFSVTLGALGQLCMKQGMSEIGAVTLRLSEVLPILGRLLQGAFVPLGILLYAVSMISWLVVLSRVELSYAYPMISLGYVAVVLLSYLVLHEPLSAAKLVGVGVICIGVLILSRHS